MWSTVTTIFASTDAGRNVTGETIVPSRSRSVRGGEAGERRPGVERAGGLASHDRAVVVGAEEPFEAGRLGCAREREPLLPRHALLAFDHQTRCASTRA